MANPFFSGRIPPSLLERIEQHVRESGQSKTETLINALAAYLNCPITNPASTTNSFEVKERLKSLENRVTALELGVPADRPCDQGFVISFDNKGVEDAISLSGIDNGLSTKEEENLLEENADNRLDNKVENETEQIEPISTEEDNDFDNKESELKSQENEKQVDRPSQGLDKVKSFESLSSIEFAKATG